MNFIEHLKTDHNIILNSQEEIAVLSIDGATLLLAVPGSGKTTVIIARIGNMLYNHSIRPEQILTLTFSIAAARDMTERFVSIFGYKFADRLQFKTIHSFCYTVIKDYERMFGKKAFDILEFNAPIIKQIYLELYKEYIGEDILRAIIQSIGYCKNMMKKNEDIEKISLPDCNFAEIYKAYEDYKLQNKLMDYDDMLNYAFTILNKYSEILEIYQNKYRYFNVDEAQDTSFVQHEIIRLLVRKSNNIFMVGDEDQSIYGFRAAFPKALLDFRNNYKTANVLLMEQNYRSTKKIVDNANRFIKQNKDRYPKNMHSENDDGCEIKQTRLNELNEQYKYITNQIKDEKHNASIAVLYRNNDSAVPVVDALEHEKIPFYIKENKPTFFTHFVTNDILCFIRLAQNSSDIDAFEKIYYKIYCGITKLMFEFAKQNAAVNIFDILIEMPNLNNKTAEKIKAIKEKFLNLKNMKPINAIEFIEYQMGYLTNIKNLSDKGYSKETLMQKLNILKCIASKRDRLDDFSERLHELEKIMLNSGSKSNSVTLTTVHSSKGLEFDKVIMIDVIDGQFPSQESIKLLKEEDDRTMFEEEVRLFYVGVTRAKKDLEIITANMQRELNKRPGKVKMMVIPIVIVGVITLFYVIAVHLFKSVGGLM